MSESENSYEAPGQFAYEPSSNPPSEPTFGRAEQARKLFNAFLIASIVASITATVGVITHHNSQVSDLMNSAAFGSDSSGDSSSSSSDNGSSSSSSSSDGSSSSSDSAWPPPGYTEWPDDSNIAYKWINQSCTGNYGCVHASFISQNGCSNFYAAVNWLDAPANENGSVIGYSNNSLPSLGAMQTATLIFEDTSDNGKSAQMSEINCG